MTDRALYYCVHAAAVTSRADKSGSPKWSQAFDAPQEADRRAAELYTSGEATLTFVVRFADGKREVMESHIKPASAAKISQPPPSGRVAPRLPLPHSICAWALSFMTDAADDFDRAQARPSARQLHSK